MRRDVIRAIEKVVQKLARLARLDVVPFDHRLHPLARRLRLLSVYGIDTVIDVGANSGQYARGLRRLGYRGRIISIEPLSSAFAELKRNHARAPVGWEIVNVALGDRPGRAVLNIAANSYSSSILPMLPAHRKSAPESKFVGQEDIAVETLDSIVEKMADPSDRIFVKSDTQGYDATVLAGAGKSLERVRGIQVEMSIVPLYEGELLLVDMIRYLGERGFTLMSLEPGFADPTTGQLLQTDGIFFRSTP